MSVITVRLPAEQHLDLVQEAGQRQMSLNAWCLAKLRVGTGEPPPWTDLVQRRLLALGFTVEEVRTVTLLSGEQQKMLLRALDAARAAAREEARRELFAVPAIRD